MCLISSETDRLVDTWNNTETKWYPIPVALGLSVIGFIQYRRVRQREDAIQERPKYAANGPWQVKVIVLIKEGYILMVFIGSCSSCFTFKIHVPFMGYFQLFNHS